MIRIKQYGWWFLVALIRAGLWLIGLVAVFFSVLGDGVRHTPKIWRMWANANFEDDLKWSRWEAYKEWAFRNPTPGWIGRWDQPVPEVRPNPDHLVRIDGLPKAKRWMENGIYWEYWTLRKIDWTFRGKHYQWFEFRIGWKFVDGNDEFFPTLQWGPRSS